MCDGPLTVWKAAQATGVPVTWLKAEAKAGRVPCLKVGLRYLFDLTALREALRRRAAGEYESAVGGASHA